MTLIVHPTMPGTEVDVPDSSLPTHQAAGWVVKGSEDDPEVQAAAAAAQGQGDPADPAKQPELPDTEKDKTPKSRRSTTQAGSTTKDGE